MPDIENIYDFIHARILNAYLFLQGPPNTLF